MREHRSALRVLYTLSAGSLCDVPGASARDVREALQCGAVDSIVALLSPQYSEGTRTAACRVVLSVATPDVDLVGARGEWRPSARTHRQRSLGAEPLLLERLVAWLHQTVARHEANCAARGGGCDVVGGAARRRASREKQRATGRRCPRVGTAPAPRVAESWQRDESELCLLLCRALRSHPFPANAS